MVGEVVDHQDAGHLAPDLLTPLHAEEGRAAGGVGLEGDAERADGRPGAERVLHVVESRDGEMHRTEPPPVVDQGESHAVRVVRQVERLHVGRVGKDPPQYVTTRARPARASATAVGQAALTAMSPSGGTRATKRSNAEA